MANYILLELLLFLALMVFIIIIYKKYIFKQSDSKCEGFQQKERFLLKENENIYDDFYGEIYDDIMQPEIKDDLRTILRTLMPDKEKSTMLDVGSGTGVLVNDLKRRGYRAYGIDKSQAMADIATGRYDVEIKCADVENSMAYDRALFTHIFCMNFTIYEIENKRQFFKNCFFWLQNNGYLILHLADKDNFDRIVPGAKHNNKQMGDKKINVTEIDFPDFSYKSEYKDRTNMEILHIETFTDKITQNIRQNEQILKFSNFDEIIDLAFQSGFIAKGYFTMKRDSNQRIYILERTM